jgi:hypothetical protein
VGGPVADAPGWRVTRRVGSPTGNQIRAPLPPRPAAPQPKSIDPQTAPAQLGVPARSPRRIGPPERRRRGISLLALAAAAAVVMFVLGLAALEMRMTEWPQASPGRSSMDDKSGQNPEVGGRQHALAPAS